MIQPLFKQAADWEIVTGQICTIEKTRAGVRINVRINQRAVLAQPAASCLLQAAVGDQVLLAGDHQHYWLLAILQRDSQQVAQLQVSGGLTIATDGDLTLRSNRDLQINSAGAQRLTARQWCLASQQVDVRCHRANLITHALQLTCRTVSQWADQIEQVAGRLLQRFTQRICRVEEHDEQHSGSHRHLIKGSATLQAESVVHKARGHVIIDGQQIHLG